jgi:hypothetical protein
MNYSATFDHLVKQTIGVGFKGKSLTEIHGLLPSGDGTNYMVANMEEVYSDAEFGNTKYPEDQLVRHLMYPLGFRRLREYVNDVYRIMAGSTSLSLNRPKFLSDQLWNKVLLNNLYDKAEFGDDRLAVGLVESRRSAEFRGDPKTRSIRVDLQDDQVADDTKEPLILGLISENLKADAAAGRIVKSLSYMKTDGDVEEVYSASANSHRLGLEGYLRYNTRLVRWIEWIAQAQRVVRILMRQQLEWIQDPVVREHNAIAESTTEFGSDNRGYMLQDFE